MRLRLDDGVGCLRLRLLLRFKSSDLRVRGDLRAWRSEPVDARIGLRWLRRLRGDRLSGFSLGLRFGPGARAGSERVDALFDKRRRGDLGLRR